jgi:hypothetical protein
MGQDGFYIPSEGRRADDFFSSLKNPTASAGFVPANLGTKGESTQLLQNYVKLLFDTTKTVLRLTKYIKLFEGACHFHAARKPTNMT